MYECACIASSTASDYRTMSRLVTQATGVASRPTDKSYAAKLHAVVTKLTTQVSILTVENTGLQRALNNERKEAQAWQDTYRGGMRRRRSRTYLLEPCKEGGAKDLLVAIDQAKKAEQDAKAQRKKERQLITAQKQIANCCGTQRKLERLMKKKEAEEIKHKEAQRKAFEYVVNRLTLNWVYKEEVDEYGDVEIERAQRHGRRWRYCSGF